jgi:hypothetical protein
VLIGAQPSWFKNITEELAMPTSVIGLFEDQDTARKVVDALTKAGVNEDAVETWSDTSADKVTERLVAAGYDEDKAQRYGEVLETGGALIVADVDDDKADTALETMRKFVNRLPSLTPDRRAKLTP